MLLGEERAGELGVDVERFKRLLLAAGALLVLLAGSGVAAGALLEGQPSAARATLGGAAWPTSTITARTAVYYKSRGGAASADELVAVVDFGSDVVSTADTFTLSASTITAQN
jgi:hypothetical protein